MHSQNTFVRGAMLLALSAVVSKLLGSVYTIVLQNIIGDQGMGLFQMAYPVYATLLAMATAGIPVAVSKLVSERMARNDGFGAYRVYRVSGYVLVALGVIAFIVLYAGAPVWAQLVGDERAVLPIRAIAPALLVVPMASALRGYFQGTQWMKPTAVSQVIEQFVRVGSIVGLALWLTHRGFSTATAAAGATFGAVPGAVAALLVLLYYGAKSKVRPSVKQVRRAHSTGSLARELVWNALPITLAALVVPMMNNVDVITVVNLLKHAGLTQSQATANFGVLSARAFKLMMFPTTLAAGVGIAAMPAISDAVVRGDASFVSRRVDLAIRLTIYLALPASIGLALLAKPVDIALFRNDVGVGAIRILAFATLFAGLQTTTAAILQGAGRMYQPVLHLLLAAVVKGVGNVLLVPHFGINGAAMATVLSYAVAAMLNLRTIGRSLHEPIRWGHWVVRPALATFVMAGVTFAMWAQWSRWRAFAASRMENGLFTVAACVLGATVYTVALLATGAVDSEALSSVPRIGPFLLRVFQKIGLVR